MGIDGFGKPLWFVLLVPIAALVLGYVRLARRHRLPATGHAGAVLGLLGCLALTIGFAEPLAPNPVPRNQGELTLALDGARPGHGLAAANGLVWTTTPGIALGLVTGSSAMTVPPTPERAPVLAALERAGKEHGAGQPDMVAEALRATRSTVPATPVPERIVLLGDGTGIGPEEFASAAECARAHIPVDTFLVGAADQGSHPDALRRLAAVSGGTSVKADSVPELQEAYSALRDRIGYDVVRSSVSRPFLGMAVAALIAAALFGLFAGERARAHSVSRGTAAS
ncbi:hypothetical protein [Sciscionella marina]|uniref:hypothetical protein n=1 Tax=Sciscionella marina TaxID=508770 RepID=UPI000399A294|nr:hypothetical protein [Sciscionella marina]